MPVSMPILTHTLHLRTADGETPFAIRIFKPEQTSVNAWTCRYEIDWPDRPRAFAAAGIDALQALVHASQMIGAEIYTSDAHREGHLRAYESEEGYGFPVVNTPRDLLVGVDRVGM